MTVEVEIVNSVLEIGTPFQVVEVSPAQFEIVEIGAAIVTNIYGDGTSVAIVGEVPMGAVNGSNATFVSVHSFVPESVRVYLNGVRQKIVSDYVLALGTTISFFISPVVGDSILIDYQRS
jgi:hypothetical protein